MTEDLTTEIKGGSQESTVRKSGISEAFSGLRVSLVPKDLLGQEGPDFRLRLLGTVMALVVVTVGILVGYYVLNRRLEAKSGEKVQLERQQEAVASEAEAKELEMGEAMRFSRQLGLAAKVLDRHRYPTELIEFLESNTLGGIRYDRMTVDTDSGLVSLDVRAPKYRAMAQQLIHFSGLNEVLQMRNTSVAGDVNKDGLMSGVYATVILTVDPKVWTGHPSVRETKGE
ncbi:hypothetical protein JW899_01695 [Candidatus Uhrbacteria bacterium]|nr:hypothetical protein [Candidatus Uhrbacteria bacterium]